MKACHHPQNNCCFKTHISSGYWRVLDFDFLVQVVSHLLQLCDENDWTNTGIPIEECVQVLQELYPKYESNTKNMHKIYIKIWNNLDKVKEHHIFSNFGSFRIGGAGLRSR